MKLSSRIPARSGLCLLLFIAGCAARGGADSARRPEEPLRLVFIGCSKDSRFYEPLKKGMRDAARMLQVQCDFTGTPGVDVEAQAEMVREAVAQGYQGIALSIIDPVAFDGVIQEAAGAGVPVVGFNVDDHATPNARLAAVAQRLYEAGRKLGLEIAPRIPRGGHVLLTMHDEGISALEDRRRGIQDALRPADLKWTVLITGNRAETGAEVIADALRRQPDICAVIGTGQADTEAAGLVIERRFAGRGLWSAGFDLSEETLRLIRSGPILCTIDQQPYIQGFYPVVQLTHYLRYGLRPPDLDAGAVVIDRTNAGSVAELTRENYR